MSTPVSYQLPEYFMIIIKEILKYESVTPAMFIKKTTMQYIKGNIRLDYAFSSEIHFSKFPRISGYLSLTKEELKEVTAFKTALHNDSTTFIVCLTLWNSISEIRDFYEQIMQEGYCPGAKLPVKHIIIEKDPKDWS